LEASNRLSTAGRPGGWKGREDPDKEKREEKGERGGGPLFSFTFSHCWAAQKGKGENATKRGEKGGGKKKRFFRAACLSTIGEKGRRGEEKIEGKKKEEKGGRPDYVSSTCVSGDEGEEKRKKGALKGGRREIRLLLYKLRRFLRGIGREKADQGGKKKREEEGRLPVEPP